MNVCVHFVTLMGYILMGYIQRWCKFEIWKVWHARNKRSYMKVWMYLRLVIGLLFRKRWHFILLTTIHRFKVDFSVFCSICLNSGNTKPLVAKWPCCFKDIFIYIYIYIYRSVSLQRCNAFFAAALLRWQKYIQFIFCCSAGVFLAGDNYQCHITAWISYQIAAAQ